MEGNVRFRENMKARSLIPRRDNILAIEKDISSRRNGAKQSETRENTGETEQILEKRGSGVFNQAESVRCMDLVMIEPRWCVLINREKKVKLTPGRIECQVLINQIRDEIDKTWISGIPPWQRELGEGMRGGPSLLKGVKR